MRNVLTQQRLRELINYDPLSGLMSWRSSRSGVRAGPVIPSSKARYAMLCIDRQAYYVHRLAFLYMLGRWPLNEVDHADRDKLNNRWSNLREANRKQNIENQSVRSSNTSGHTGVTWNRRLNKWQARIRDGERRIYLGCFETAELASAARKAAAQQIHKEFAR